MEGNPYTEILNTVGKKTREGAFAPVLIGTVTSVLPFAVSAGGVVLTSASGLMISADLLPRKRTLKLTNPNENLEINVTGAVSGTLKVAAEKLDTEVSSEEQEGSLMVGDHVLIVTGDGNIYTVICKAVSA